MAPPTMSSKQQGGGDDSETPSNNLWVGNLAVDITDSDLMDLFAQYGALDSVTSYSSRSYAFVFFKRMEDAKAAKDALQGTNFRGNPLKIEFARPVRSDLWVPLGLFCYSSSNWSEIVSDVNLFNLNFIDIGLSHLFNDVECRFNLHILRISGAMRFSSLVKIEFRD